ncbi:DcrB-related protein [Polyangium mundeleinium]|uniref:DcrB-related protein n=1 Tax=Polyangium mundeleinium TaxID=2995306 RepID=A0ABT5F652_9BACT|nr:DcrB-related protein [Polyangium mundeleinium]MDC0748878.1 DcrB-related protein [Polyangium mundeleinium]
MRTYHTDELLFDVPDEWSDRSVNIFVSAPGDRVPFNVVVTRDQLGDAELRPFVLGKLKEISKSVPKLNILGQRERMVGPLSGLEARLQWPMQGGTMYQHQVYVPYYGEVLIFTASSLVKLAPQCDAYLEQMLSGIKFRKQ